MSGPGKARITAGRRSTCRARRRERRVRTRPAEARLQPAGLVPARGRSQRIKARKSRGKSWDLATTGPPGARWRTSRAKAKEPRVCPPAMAPAPVGRAGKASEVAQFAPGESRCKYMIGREKIFQKYAKPG